MNSLNISRDQFLELEKIAIGAFSPLKGFMNEIEFNSVVERMRLPSGEVFPLPVLMDVNKNIVQNIKKYNEIELFFNNDLVGKLIPNDYFSCDRHYIAKKIFGTDDPKHPGVDYFYKLKPVFVGGEVQLLKSPKFGLSSKELTPVDTVNLFKNRGWKTIVGFQTRNIPHRAHEYLQRVALEQVDGLFIQPLVGKKKVGDFTPEAIFNSYDALIKNFFPKNRVLLSFLSTVMRYAGPREAVFHAIIRKNYGCTHFIVGRDHAGVDDWYGTYDAHELTRKFDGELGIEIMRLKGPFFCKKCNTMATENTCSHVKSDFIQQISGTNLRKIISQGKVPNTNIIRKEILDSLINIKCFIE